MRQFPDQGSNPGPLQWEDRVLATRPPVKSPMCLLIFIYIYLLYIFTLFIYFIYIFTYLFIAFVCGLCCYIKHRAQGWPLLPGSKGHTARGSLCQNPTRNVTYKELWSAGARLPGTEQGREEWRMDGMGVGVVWTNTDDSTGIYPIELVCGPAEIVICVTSGMYAKGH